MKILVVDNYDSFVFNLVQYLGQLGADADVWRNDDPRLGEDLADLSSVVTGYDGVLLSPGPGTPERAGKTMDLVSACAATATPTLGVCLGHQAIGAVFGATVERAPELLHGKTSVVHHHGLGLLAGLPDPFTATRYHSLTIRPDTVGDQLEVLGVTDSGIIMALRHRTLPIHGVQFHPESVLSQGGHRLLANWLAVCGMPFDGALVASLETEVAAALAP